MGGPQEWLETLRSGKCIPEAELRQLCSIVKEILLEESNIQPVHSPVTVCGDIHGQFFDLLELFRTAGEVPKTSYIFMGDFVDRGHNSVECFELLMCLKACFPAHITLLRGNHESRQITQVCLFCCAEDEVFHAMDYFSFNASTATGLMMRFKGVKQADVRDLEDF